MTTDSNSASGAFGTGPAFGYSLHLIILAFVLFSCDMMNNVSSIFICHILNYALIKNVVMSYIFFRLKMYRKFLLIPTYGAKTRCGGQASHDIAPSANHQPYVISFVYLCLIHSPNANLVPSPLLRSMRVVGFAYLSNLQLNC